MANLAIGGHPTRGREVIAWLEMLGGENRFQREGDNERRFYYIDKNKRIQITGGALGYILFELEEFEKLYPYKVGDKVIMGDFPCVITSVTWDPINNDIFYYVKGDDFHVSADVDSLKPYKEQETMDKTKFPYEIGTRVSVKGTYFDKLATIVGLSYNSCACMQYEIQFDGEDVVVHYPTHLMTPIITEQSMGEKDEKTVNHVFDTDVISFDFAQKNEYELDLQGKFEVVLREGKYYVERIKLKYPKDYVECCKVLGCKADDFFTDFSYNNRDVEISDYEDKIDDLLQNFRKLRYCRDAYWKIAGEQMGLGKPWEPDWCNENKLKYCIECSFGTIDKTRSIVNGCFLAFPTKKMRDAFYENFKDLINDCKELL